MFVAMVLWGARTCTCVRDMARHVKTPKFQSWTFGYFPAHAHSHRVSATYLVLRIDGLAGVDLVERHCVVAQEVVFFRD